MRYQIEANFISLLFPSPLMHLIHFNTMFSCNSLNPLIMHMGFCQMQFKLHMGPFKMFYHVYQFILMHLLTCHASSHVCALCHVIDCPSLFVVCLLLLDQTTTLRQTRFTIPLQRSQPSTRLLSLQASIHSHEPLFPVNHWIPFFLLSILLALFIRCLCSDPITCSPVVHI